MGEVVYALRSLRLGRRRFALGVVSIVITLLLMETAAIVFNSFQAGLISQATEMVGYDLLVGRDPTDLEGDLTFPPEQVTDVLRKERAVRDVFPALLHPVLNAIVVAGPRPAPPGGANTSFGVLFAVPQGYDPGRLVSLDGEYRYGGSNAVVSRQLARALDVAVGDSIRVTVYRVTNLSAAVNLTGGLPGTIETKTVPLTVTGIVATRGRFPAGSSNYVLTELATGLALYNTTRVSSVVAMVDPALYDPDNLAAPARELFDLGRRVATGLGPAFAVIAPRGTILAAATETTRSTTVFSYLFAAFFPAISGVLIASVLNLSVEEKAKDLATMRLLGARRPRIARVIAIELGVILAVGAPLGIVLGILAPYGLRDTGFLPADTLVIDPTVVGIQALLALGGTVLFAAGPLRAALRSDPISALRTTRSEGEFRLVRVGGVDRRMTVSALLLFATLLYATFVIPWVLAFAFTTTFLVLFLFSLYLLLASLSIGLLGLVPVVEDRFVAALGTLAPFRPVARLTRTNLRRSLRRHVSTNVLFALNVAMMVFFSTYVAVLDENGRRGLEYSIGADIRGSSLGGFSSFQVDGASTIPGVEATAAVTVPIESFSADLITSHFGDVRLYGVRGDLAGATALDATHFASGGPAAFRQLDSGGLVLSAAAADLLDVAPGDIVVLRVQRERAFVPVLAVLKTMPGYPLEVREQMIGGFPPVGFVGLPVYETLSGLPQRQVAYQDLFIGLAPGADADKVARALMERFGREPGFAVFNTRELLAHSQDLSADAALASGVISFLLIVVAVFSLTANLYASVQERRFEVGVLRAIGLRASGVAHTILLEGTAIAVVSLLIGIISGIVVAWILILVLNIYIPVAFRLVIPWQPILLLSVFAIIAALAGSRFPALQAARQDIQGLIRRLGT